MINKKKIRFLKVKKYYLIGDGDHIIYFANLLRNKLKVDVIVIFSSLNMKKKI